jgi:4-diphosphocytidyl-2-C-methyl-D-erythritol kinase
MTIPPLSPKSHVEYWPAPAKLNLFLHITGRRPDGYHLLQTVFQFIDYCDLLHFEVRRDGLIRRVTETPGVDERQDLVWRAASLLQHESNVHLGVNISIIKRIPMGGGLGGGSSDAATTLVALNRLWNLGLSVPRLADLGIKLGADVPVFINGYAAWAEGVGEKLQSVSLPEPWYVVVMPPCQVATGEIFAAPELTRDANPIKIRDFLAGQGVNVCEPVVRTRYPVVGEVLDWLSQYSKARLTGTGACVFAAFENERLAQEVMGKIPLQWAGFVAKGLNTSPLYSIYN